MTPVQCYLDYKGIVQLAKKQGVDVIHPGYGFLSENASFARECASNGITVSYTHLTLPTNREV